MAENSKIEWTDHTFNPWIGCSKVSDGCKYCYAEEMMDKRFGKVKWGTQGTRVRTSRAYWGQPIKWNRDAVKKGVRYRVFCASLADVFEDKPDQPEMNDWRADLMFLIQDTPNLDWLLLTKRPENIMPMFNKSWTSMGGACIDKLPDNVWIGTSVENQEQADKRIPKLLGIPAKVRFLSMEPLLEKVDISCYIGIHKCPDCGVYEQDQGFATTHCATCGHEIDASYEPPYVDWVIVGGESGNKARRFDLSWAYSIVNQCQAASIPVFVKQFGENPTSIPCGYKFTDKKAGNWDEWPEDLRVREYPHTS